MFLSDVKFPTPNTGYIVGGMGTILKTTNGGSSWSNLNPSYQVTPMTLWSVFFLDANTGYIGGRYGTLLKTTNGGTSWTTLNPGVTDDITSVFFTDANTGYATVGPSGSILKTTNGGVNWVTQLTVPSADGGFASVWFTDANHGHAVGDCGLYNTANGGSTWTKVPDIYGNDVFFTDNNTGHIVAWNMDPDPQIFITTNGGCMDRTDFRYDRRLKLCFLSKRKCRICCWNDRNDS